MVLIIRYGTQLFGKSDHFTVDGQEAFVQTKFYHVGYMPCAPEESYLFLKDGATIQLPEIAGATILWAWLRYILTLLFGLALCGCIITFIVMTTKDVLPWVCLGLCIFFFIVLIASYVYKPKASEANKQKYLQILGHVQHSKIPVQASEADPLLAPNV
ncbi:uncharacterized protein LOC118413396 [Branchiostoma floridae]|uniref:Uncharacterized protein LOC118413396 n=1 Tax=Branchiostoma floridae TaxID=7739 RepID=A0A9J7KZN0_BRAFL|nr:uncharacterized protein LOC118413396 [Branchiostoma floridae]